jgi:hypothetical protein
MIRYEFYVLAAVLGRLSLVEMAEGDAEKR